MSGRHSGERQLHLELPNGPNPQAAASPGLPAAVDPMEVFRFLRSPSLAVSAGLPEISHGPVLLLRFWLRHSPTQDWQAGGRPVVFATMREAAAQLNVTERTARRYARCLRDAGAWTPVNRPGSGPAQGVDLSPLAGFIEKLRTIAERQRALRAERDELKTKYHEARRENLARINRMHRTGLLTECEANKLHHRLGERFRLETRPTLNALAWHIDELKQLLARVDYVETQFRRIQAGLPIDDKGFEDLIQRFLDRYLSDHLSRKENPDA
ncbi:MAG: hypothetical protein OXG99_12155 [Alphaproteobacteria bacterium]|nr:hypothetical protein [Alphaproteobacteria bacterium]